MKWIEGAILVLAVSSVSDASGLFGTPEFANAITQGANAFKLCKKTRSLSKSADLLLAEPFALSRVDVNASRRFNLVRTRFVGGIDYHLSKNLIIWSEVSTGAILTRDLNACGSEIDQKHLLVEKNPGSWRPKAIAVDFVADNLYVLDSRAKRVWVFDLDTKLSTVIYDGDLEEPLDLVIDPMEGFVFIADGKKILRLNMDGSAPRTIVDYEHYNIKSVAVDLVNKRLYWSDESFHRIKSARYDGSDVVVALKNQAGKSYSLLGPANLAFRDETLYFYDDMFRRVSSVQVEATTGRTDESTFRVVYDGINVQSMKVMDARMREMKLGQENPCQNENAGCRHICLIASRTTDGLLSSKCACNLGYDLADDLKTCIRTIDLERR